jgi:hypothetical protein
MFRIVHKNWILAAILGALATSLLVVLIVAGIARANFRAHLQSLSDDAASAAVAALGANVGQTETDRRGTAMMAAQEAIAGEVVQSRIAISIETMRVAVALTAEQPTLLGRYLSVTPGIVNVASSAEYVPPDQPSNWSWASRQYFAGQRQGVVLRSTCSAAACGTQKMP